MSNEEIEKLYNENKETAKAFALAMCQNIDDADDIVQDAFLSLLENAGNIDQKGAKQYLFRTVHNKTIDHYRKNKLHNEIVTDLIDIDPNDENDYPELHNAIQNLPDRQAIAIFLYYWKRMEYKEIAKEMGCTENAVDKLLRTAKTKLRDMMTNG